MQIVFFEMLVYFCFGDSLHEMLNTIFWEK